MSYFPTTNIQASDSPSIDAFSRLRVSNPVALFTSTFEYNLNPIIFEQITSGTGSISHDAVNSCATFSATTGGVGSASMQSYEYIRYQPGKSQLAILTFKFGIAAANVTRRIGLYDSDNGFYLEQTGASTVNLVRRSSSTTGAQTVAQANWNIDPMDGTGPSGCTLDLSKCQILIIDAQWLGVGRVRVGFDIDGLIYYVHEFLHANSVTDVYTKTLNLPVKAELITTSNVDATMNFICTSVSSEGGDSLEQGYNFTTSASKTANSGSRTHLLSIRPRDTFNGLNNRSRVELDSVDIVVTGANPVSYELCIGTGITPGATFSNVNGDYSTVEYNTAANYVSAPTIVINSGYCAATAQTKQSIRTTVKNKYPITLDAVGNHRDDGTISVLITGIGGTSATRVIMNWKEIR